MQEMKGAGGKVKEMRRDRAKAMWEGESREYEKGTSKWRMR
jgi:hypothetical protein